MSSNLELGTTVECNKWWHLSSIFFPSKVGGKPAWLSPSGVPIDDLRCNLCERPFTFLLQVYAPGPSEESQAFHRTIFIFMCPNADCHNKFNSQLGKISGQLKPRIPFRVLRCQLARENPFYLNVPVSENISESEAFPLIANLYKSPAINNGHSNSSDSTQLLTENTSENNTEANGVSSQTSPSNASLCVPCHLCGVAIRDVKRCGKCRLAAYCCRQHQERDWSSHKFVCNNPSMNALYAYKAQPGGQSPEVLPEFELVIHSAGPEYDLESDADSDSSESDEEDDQWEDEEDGDERPSHRESALEEQYRQMERINGAIRGKLSADSDVRADVPDMDEADAKESATGGPDEVAAFSHTDKQLLKFKRAIKSNPNQVLRYQQGGKPLWISSKHVPSSESDIPPCEYCGAARIFEFQVMPQLLNVLQLDETPTLKAGEAPVTATSIDWGVLAIYTCSRRCTPSTPAEPVYRREFIWAQPGL